MKKNIVIVFLFIFLFSCTFFLANQAKGDDWGWGMEGGDVYWGESYDNSFDDWVDYYEPTPDQQQVIDADNWVDYYEMTPGQNQALGYPESPDYGENPMAGMDQQQQYGGTGGDYLEFAQGNDFVKLEDGTYGFKMTDGKYYWQDEEGGFNPVDMSGVGGGVADSSGVRDLVGTNQYGNPMYSDGAGNYYELNSTGFVNASGSDMAITPLSAGQQVAIPESSGVRDLVGTNQYGNPMYKDNAGNYYELGANGFNNASGSDMTITPLTASQQAASSVQFQSGQSTSTFTPAQIITGSNGQLYQMSGTQVIPYTGSTGMVSSSGGILNSVGSFVGGLLGMGASNGYVGYNQAAGGLFGGLGFGGNGTSGGVSYNPSTGWSGGLGFGNSGTAGYSGAGGFGSTGMAGYSGAGSSILGGMGGGGMGWNPGNYIGTGLPTGSVYNIIQGIVFWILAIFGFVCIIGFIISGIMYLLAAGDEKAQEKAKKALYYSITGVIVGLLGLVIIFAVNALLRGASYF